MPNSTIPPVLTPSTPRSVRQVLVVSDEWGDLTGVPNITDPNVQVTSPNAITDPFPFATQAIAIHPTSLVDHAILINAAGTEQALASGQVNVSVESPWVTPIGPGWQAANTFLNSNLDTAAIFTALMFDETGASLAFPPPFAVAAGTFVQPGLILVAYLNLNPMMPATKRVPLSFSTGDLTVGTAVAERILACFPISGRKHVRVTVRSSAAINARLTGSRGGTSIPATATSPLYEVPLVPNVAIGAGDGGTLAIENPGMYWLFVRASGAVGSIRIDCTAVD